jgi:hypothetical protein
VHSFFVKNYGRKIQFVKSPQLSPHFDLDETFPPRAQPVKVLPPNRLEPSEPFPRPFKPVTFESKSFAPSPVDIDRRPIVFFDLVTI